jgi:hypothetical protein
MVAFDTILNVIPILSLVVVLAYYSLQIRNQNKSRQAQVYLTLYNKWDEKQQKAHAALRAAEFSNIDEYLEKYGPDTNPEFQHHVGQLINFYEGIGVMVKEGFLSMRLVALSWAGAIRVFWEKFEPIMDDLCEYYDYPRLWSETIYLCRELMKYMDEHPELKT